MNNSKRVWTPKSPMSRAQKSVLSVEASKDQPMSRDLLISLLEIKFRRLIQAEDPKRVEHLLEDLLGWNLLLKEYPGAIANSEEMEQFLNLIDWEREKRPRGLSPKIEELTLWEILEQLAQ